MSNIARNTAKKKISRNLAERALDRTCWFLSWQLTGKRNDRRYRYRISEDDSQAFICDLDLNEVEGSRKTLDKWAEIGRQLRLAEAAIWLKLGEMPKPAEEPDPRKRVRFWYWFDGIRRVFVFHVTVGRNVLPDKEVNKRFQLHRRLWVLASQGAAIEQLHKQLEKKLARSEQQVLETLTTVSTQLGLAGAMHPPISHLRSIAYSS